MERTLDAKGRWRNRTVGFRVSEEEAKMIDHMVALSGLTKQEYILRKLMDCGICDGWNSGRNFTSRNLWKRNGILYLLKPYRMKARSVIWWTC